MSAGPSGGPPPGRVETSPAARDPRLRGRTFAIPFERVWSAALLLAAEEMPRWEVTSWNDRTGTIQAYAERGRLQKSRDEVKITVKLDEYAQTRLDIAVVSKKGESAAAQRIDEFIKALDRRLKPDPSQVLDPGYWSGKRNPPG